MLRCRRELDAYLERRWRHERASWAYDDDADEPVGAWRADEHEAVLVMPPIPGPKTRYPAAPHNTHGIDAGISDTNQHYNQFGADLEVPYGGGKYTGGPQQQPAFHPHQGMQPHPQAPMPAPSPIAYPGAVMMLMNMMRGGQMPGSGIEYPP